MDREADNDQEGNERKPSGCGAPGFPFTEKYEIGEEGWRKGSKRDIVSFFAASKCYVKGR